LTLLKEKRAPTAEAALDAARSEAVDGYADWKLCGRKREKVDGGQQAELCSIEPELIHKRPSNDCFDHPK